MRKKEHFITITKKEKKSIKKKKQAKLIYSVRCQDNDKLWAGKRLETGKAPKGNDCLRCW